MKKFLAVLAVGVFALGLAQSCDNEANSDDIYLEANDKDDTTTGGDKGE